MVFLINFFLLWDPAFEQESLGIIWVVYIHGKLLAWPKSTASHRSIIYRPTRHFRTTYRSLRVTMSLINLTHWWCPVLPEHTRWSFLLDRTSQDEAAWGLLCDGEKNTLTRCHVDSLSRWLAVTAVHWLAVTAVRWLAVTLTRCHIDSLSRLFVDSLSRLFPDSLSRLFADSLSQLFADSLSRLFGQMSPLDFHFLFSSQREFLCSHDFSLFGLHAGHPN